MARTKIARYAVVGKDHDGTDIEGMHVFHKTKRQAVRMRDGMNNNPSVRTYADGRQEVDPRRPYRVVRLNVEIVEVDDPSALPLPEPRSVSYTGYFKFDDTREDD